MANNILKYTSRDYNSIKSDLISAISTLSDTWTSRDDGDPGIVLVKLMSALGDMLSYNFDKQALEYYGPTVTQRKNAQRLFSLVGYYMRWYRAARTTVELTYRATMPEFVYYYKRIIDGENPEDVYYDYRVNYTTIDPNDNTKGQISCPPDSEPLFGGQTERYTVHLGGVGEEDVEPNIIDPYFPINATWFKEVAQKTFKFWQHDNSIGLYTYLEDSNKTLSLYSSGAQSISYSLIPTNIEPTVVNLSTNQYEPNIVLLPYEPKQLPAIQGDLCSVTFTNAQLKDNRYYIPDTQLDDTEMWLSYISIDDATNKEKYVFLYKTDNLLTITDFKDDDGSTKIYFQFGVDEFDFPYIELASYWDTVITEESVKFKFYYMRTLGKYGNITTNYLTEIATNESADITVTNIANTEYVVDDIGSEYLSAPGYNPQTAEDAYVDSVNYVMTYNTLVTIYDFSRFLKRQNGVSNGFACDGQHADDLNGTTTINGLLQLCQSYTKEQLLDILGHLPELETKSQNDLAKYLYEIRKIVYDYKQAYVTKNDVDTASQQSTFIPYSVNLYPIWNDFELVDSTGKSIATYTNRNSNNEVLPYYLYMINTEETVGSSDQDKFAIEKRLNEAISETKIVTTEPRYTACRVFPWRCCGTVHLTQSVTPQDAETIIKSIVNTLKFRYAPQNMEFGKKITYMDVIETIMSADSRIRYFDAGIGNRKLIDFENNVPSDSGYFNIEAYFNPESIMRYVQTYEELTDENSQYYNMICIDPSYIQTKV